MPASKIICLVGQVIVDVDFSKQILIRLGGIFHAARALWALEVPFILAYIAPKYLRQQIIEQASNLGAREVCEIGSVTGSPNIMCIMEPTEAGSQGYEFLLREEHCSSLDTDRFTQLIRDKFISDIVIFPGEFDLKSLLQLLSSLDAQIYIDIAYGVNDISILNYLGRSFDGIAISTSSDLFLKQYRSSVQTLAFELVDKYCNSVLFKENRGGARLFLPDSHTLCVGAQLRRIEHSVGVGDCFDVAFAALSHEYEHEISLNYASWISADYASTYNPHIFKQSVRRTISIPPSDIQIMQGVSLPWESRPEKNIYIAAPDFDYVDRTYIDILADALSYHNFMPRLPVREHGQATSETSQSEKRRLCDADLYLLRNCQMLIAVLLKNDPGTLIEIGLAVERGMPVAVYDPYELADNLMLTQLPCIVSSNLSSIITEVFFQLSR